MKSLFKYAAVTAVAAAMATSSYALTVTPAGAFTTGTQTGVPQILAEIQSNTGINLNGLELYKQNAGEASDSGSFAGSYQTSFSPDATDATGFKIDYISGSSISANPVYLLVKDGNSNPAWYLFNITGWNGTDDIDGSGFWPQKGAISHVSIYGTSRPGNGVPDGGVTLLLLGSAVAGLGLLRRKLS
jgi:VPDSG-CTERM motif